MAFAALSSMGNFFRWMTGMQGKATILKEIPGNDITVTCSQAVCSGACGVAVRRAAGAQHVIYVPVPFPVPVLVPIYLPASDAGLGESICVEEESDREGVYESWQEELLLIAERLDVSNQEKYARLERTVSRAVQTEPQDVQCSHKCHSDLETETLVTNGDRSVLDLEDMGISASESARLQEHFSAGLPHAHTSTVLITEVKDDEVKDDAVKDDEVKDDKVKDVEVKDENTEHTESESFLSESVLLEQERALLKLAELNEYTIISKTSIRPLSAVEHDDIELTERTHSVEIEKIVMHTGLSVPNSDTELSLSIEGRNDSSQSMHCNSLYSSGSDGPCFEGFEIMTGHRVNVSGTDESVTEGELDLRDDQEQQQLSSLTEESDDEDEEQQQTKPKARHCHVTASREHVTPLHDHVTASPGHVTSLPKTPHDHALPHQDEQLGLPTMLDSQNKTYQQPKNGLNVNVELAPVNGLSSKGLLPQVNDELKSNSIDSEEGLSIKFGAGIGSEKPYQELQRESIHALDSPSEGITPDFDLLQPRSIDSNEGAERDMKPHKQTENPNTPLFLNNARVKPSNDISVNDVWSGVFVLQNMASGAGPKNSQQFSSSGYDSYHLHYGSGGQSSGLGASPEPTDTEKAGQEPEGSETTLSQSTVEICEPEIQKVHEPPEGNAKLRDENKTDENEHDTNVKHIKEDTKPKETKLVFVVCADDKQIEMWIKREIEGKMNGLSAELDFVYMQEDLRIPGVKKTEHVTCCVRKAFKVLTVFSARFSDCQYAKHVLRIMVPRQEHKLIPVTIDVCDVPDMIQHITHIRHDESYFLRRVTTALSQSPQPADDSEYVSVRAYRAGQEPFLMLERKPSNPVEPHFQHSIGVPSTPDRRNDHLVVFRIAYFDQGNKTSEIGLFDLNDKSKFAPRFEIRLKIHKAWRVLSGQQGKREMSTAERAKCIRFWKDMYRQPRTQQQLNNEIGFWIRFKNPPDAHKLLAFLTFDLMMTVMEDGKSHEHLVHSMNVEFETKAKKPKQKPRPRKPHGAAGDDEAAATGSKHPIGRRLKTWKFKVNSSGAPVDASGNPIDAPTTPTDGVWGRPQQPIDDGFLLSAFHDRHATGLIDPDTGTSNATIIEEVDDLAKLQSLGNRRGGGALSLADWRAWNVYDESALWRDEAAWVEEYDEAEQEAREILPTEVTTIYPKPGMFRKKQYHDMCFMLEKLAENVKEADGARIFHAEADRLLQDYMGRKERTDERIIILLKQSGVEHYRNHLSRASEYVRQALELVPRAKYRHQMEARIYYYISSIYREKKKFGKAKFWIKRSKDMLKNVEPGEDTAKAFYNEGRLYMKILTATMRHEECRKLAVQAFDKCVLHAKHDYEKYGMRLDVKLIRRCYLNMARIYVDVPEMPMGRARELVTLLDLQMAKLCLDAVIIPEYWNNTSVRNQAHLCLAECGFFFRKAEMLHRLPEVTHRNNARKNLMQAIRRAGDMLHIPGAEQLKEYRLADEFMKEMLESRIIVKGVNAVDWKVQRALLSSEDSSDLTHSSSNEISSKTYAAEQATKKQREKTKKFLNDVSADLGSPGDVSD